MNIIILTVNLASADFQTGGELVRVWSGWGDRLKAWIGIRYILSGFTSGEAKKQRKY